MHNFLLTITVKLSISSCLLKQTLKKYSLSKFTYFLLLDSEWRKKQEMYVNKANLKSVGALELHKILFKIAFGLSNKHLNLNGD